MSIPKPLTTAIAIFRELGWETAQPEDVMSLPLGTPEQRRAAKAGLSKGEWGGFRQITGHSYGFVSDIGVDANMLGAFAIRIGVPARRAVAIAPVGWEQWPAPLRGQLFASRGAAFVSAFAAGGGRANFHTPALAYAFAASGAEVPGDTRYLESWVFLADRSFKPEDDGTGEKVPLDILRASFAAHLRAVLASGMPVPGAGWSEPILATVIREGIQRGWFDVAEARDLVLFAMDQASRPSDRLAYARALLEELQAEREWLVERSGILLSTMSQGPDQVVTLLGPIALNSGDDDAVLNAMLIGVGAKSAKAVAEILHVALDIAPPSSEIKGMIAEGLAPLLTHKNAKVARTAQRVLDTWNVTAQPLAEPEPEGVRGLWQPTPAALDVPLLETGPVTPAHLTALAARIVANDSDAVTLDAERLLWTANALARQDEDAVRTALRGVKNTWQAGLRAVSAWVKKQSITPRDEPAANRYYSLEVARDVSVFMQLGAVPNLLSTPTFQDYRIDPAQLADRLDAYVQAGVPVVEADLQMALPRLDLTLLTAETANRLKQYDLAIQLQDGNPARNASGQRLTVGAVLTRWIDQPIAQPEFTNEQSYYSSGIESVPALADLPPRYAHIWSTIDLFPNWTNAMVPRRYAAPATLRNQPNGTVPATQLLNTVGEDAADLDATILAWRGGMLEPGVAQASRLGWQGTIPSLAARVDGWSELADAGLLSVIWPLASDVIAYSSNGPRVAPGVAELVDMLTRYLPEVEAAIAAGLASPDVLAQPAIRALAVRGGSSRAVAAAKRLVALLPEVAVGVDVVGGAGAVGALGALGVEQVGLSDQEFARAWRKVQDPPVIHDGARLTVEWVSEKNGTTPVVRVTLQDGTTWETAGLNWMYSLSNEFQIPVAQWHSKDHWLNYDSHSKQLVMRVGRNNTERTHSDHVYSHTLVLWLLMTQQPPARFAGYDYYSMLGRDTSQCDVIGPRRVAKAVETLLADSLIDPYRFVRELPKNPEALSALYPALTRPIAHTAGIEGKPPAWLVRVIDVATQFAPVLREAGVRGMLLEPDAAWPGLAEIAQSSGSPAAKKKAGILLEKLGLR